MVEHETKPSTRRRWSGDSLVPDKSVFFVLPDIFRKASLGNFVYDAPALVAGVPPFDRRTRKGSSSGGGDSSLSPIALSLKHRLTVSIYDNRPLTAD